LVRLFDLILQNLPFVYQALSLQSRWLLILTMASQAAPVNPDDNHASMLYIPIAVFGVLSPALVGIRVWSRLRNRGKLGIDDYTILASLVRLLLGD
jgi:hypothetical protein